MEIRTVEYLLRKNRGNYEHEEIKLSAALGEKEDALTSISNLMRIAHDSLYGESEVEYPETTETLNDPKPKTSLTVDKRPLKPIADEPAATANHVVDADELSGDLPPPIPEEAKTPAQRKSRSASKAKDATVPPVIGETGSAVEAPAKEEEVKAPAAPRGAKTVPYSSATKEHRSRLATYLGNTFPNWKKSKPEDQIKSFSAGLDGKPFEDTKGNMLDSFKEELASFFG